MQPVGTNRRSLSHDKRQTTIGSYLSECVRIGRENNPDSIACTQNPPTLACGGGMWGNTCGTFRPQLPSHTLSKSKETHSLTLLLQSHFDHVNILLRVYVHPCCRSCKRTTTLPKSPQQSAPGSAALAHAQSVARFVSASTPPESP